MLSLIESLKTLQGAISIALCAVIVLALTFFRKDDKWTYKRLLALVAGTLTYAVLSFVSIPIGSETSFRISITILTIFGALYGPSVGFLVGFMGHAINDAFMFGSVWWSWVFLSAVIGMFSGFMQFDKGFNPLEGKFETRHIITLYVYSALSILIGGLAAFAGDLILYGEPAEIAWVQIMLASVSNFGVIAIVGIPAVITLALLNRK